MDDRRNNTDAIFGQEVRERERERSRSDDEFEGSVPRKEKTEILQRKIWVFFRALRRRDRVRAGVEYSVRKNQSAGCLWIFCNFKCGPVR